MKTSLKKLKKSLERRINKMKNLRDYLYNEIKEVEKQCNELAEEIEKTKVENKEDHFNFVFNQGRLFQLKTILVKLLTEDEE